MSTEKNNSTNSESQLYPIVHIKKEPVAEELTPASIPPDFFDDIQKVVKLEKDLPDEQERIEDNTLKITQCSPHDKNIKSLHDKSKRHKEKTKLKKLDDDFIGPLLKDDFKTELENLEIIGLQEVLREKEAMLQGLEKNQNSTVVQSRTPAPLGEYDGNLHSNGRYHDEDAKEQHKEKIETSKKIEAKKKHKKHKKTKKHKRAYDDDEKSDHKQIDSRQFKRARPAPVTPKENEIKTFETEFEPNLLSTILNNKNDWKADDVLYQEKEKYKKFDHKEHIKTYNEHLHSSKSHYRSPNHRFDEKSKNFESNSSYYNKLLKPKVETDTLPRDATLNINDYFRNSEQRNTNATPREDNKCVKLETKDVKLKTTLKLDNMSVLLTKAQHLGVYNFVNFLCDEENKKKSRREISEKLMNIYEDAQSDEYL